MQGTLRVSGDSRPTGARPSGAIGGAETRGLRWEEEGTLLWAGRRLSAERKYALSLVGGEWWMTFEDGGLFHRWRPGVRLEHPCGADRYVGLLDLEPGEMRILWDVFGPSKRQRIFTRYLARND